MSEIHGAVGSYVVNALDPAEQDEFEAHLATCPTCSDEVLELCETAAQLSLLATPAEPPPELRGSILSAISKVRVLPPILPPLAEDEPDALPTRPRRALELVARAPEAVIEDEPSAAETSPVAAGGVDELALRRQQRRARILSAAVAAVMVVALALGGVVYSLVQSRQSQVAEASLESQLISAPDAQFVSTPTKNGGTARFIVSKSENRALFTASGLPDPGAGKTYQVWTLNAAQKPVPNSLVSGSGTVKQWFTGDVAAAAGAAVSIEDAGGSKTGVPADVQGSHSFG